MSKKEVRPKFLNKKLPILYAVSAPKAEEGISQYIEALNPVFSNKNVHGISSPELVTRVEGQGKVSYVSNTIPPEDFLGSLPKNLDRITTVVVPRVPKKEFVSRLENIKSKGINSVIIVGPERPEDVVLLGGYTANEGFEIATKHGFACGGITIPWREVPVPGDKNVKPISEGERIVLKQKHGCKFVASQFIFESVSSENLLVNYSQYCKEKKLEPLTIFFSFCIVPSVKTLDFMEKLLVKIPEANRNRLLKSTNMERESIEIACDIWSAIRDTQRSSAKNVKIGLQVEPIKISRVNPSLELLDELLHIA
ncbi:TPA: hypothetical protein H1016_00885 [archaeon]|uniref:Methylenetetrahydrofolate reductase (NAD(P)H) n=1 Tax=Candidatus Naiadarchaeum limnaeum TaxID=2756139 RepID=A0A832UZC3_9ARCH|nr:hypothetical protein [Candidatus Naiadarchaeum limnaeum]